MYTFSHLEKYIRGVDEYHQEFKNAKRQSTVFWKAYQKPETNVQRKNKVEDEGSQKTKKWILRRRYRRAYYRI